jgi:hypothetical protein
MKMETPIEGGPGPCLCCGGTHSILPMEAVVAVGFGAASVTRDGELVWQESPRDEEFRTAAEFEAMALADPDHDWRIHYYGPLSEKHYQRHGGAHWVLYEKGDGFA